jgi:ankyrin repeat protein
MNVPPPPPPPQDDDPIITQFRPVDGQWGLDDYNIKRIGYGTGCTILHNYCRHINTTPLEVYRYLIETKGCDVNVQNDNNDTPVHRAFCCFNPNAAGDITIFTYLLSQTNINVNNKDQYGFTLLQRACLRINKFPLEIFKVLIEKHDADVNIQNKDKDTPLHLALRNFDWAGDITTLTYLLSQKGINVNATGEYGYSLLHYACKRVNKFPIDIFKLLITLGADVNVQAQDNDTPIHLAFHGFDANARRHIAVLKYLLTQQGIDGNIKDKHGYTVFHYACKYINKFPLEIFQHFIETHGADVNTQDNNNDTLFDLALRKFNWAGDITTLTYLPSQKGINVNIKDKNSHTLLHTACSNINKLPIDVYQMLIETHGCDVNVQNTDNDTPLHYAFRQFNPNKGGDINVLTYLRSQNNVNLNVKGKQGFNLLHSGCTNNLPSYKRSVELDAECDTVFCQIVEDIIERLAQQVLDENNLE